MGQDEELSEGLRIGQGKEDEGTCDGEDDGKALSEHQ